MHLATILNIGVFPKALRNQNSKQQRQEIRKRHHPVWARSVFAREQVIETVLPTANELKREIDCQCKA